MKNWIACTGFLFMLILLSGCQYRKGKAFTWAETGDSISYLILESGSGKHIAAKIARLTNMHEGKNDKFHFIYLSDSGTLLKNRSILLFNSVLPDVKDDMLSKGFMGTFNTRQDITYLVVSRADLEKLLTSPD